MKNMYYVGGRQSDLVADFKATTNDNFFRGSITIKGSGQDGNISYESVSGTEVDETRIYFKENIKIIKKFVKQQTKKIVKSDPDAMFIPYSFFWQDKIPKKFRCRVRCCNDFDLLKYLNSKFNFKELIEGHLPQAPHVYLKGTEVIANIESGKWPSEYECAVQTEYGSGGNGTWLVTKDFDKEKILSELNPGETYVVGDFIHNLASVGIQVQLSNNEVAVYPAGIQLMRGPHYIGTDIYAFTQLPEDAQKECIEVGKKFGQILKGLPQKPRGFVGLDLIVAKEGSPRVFAVETNARFTGSTGLLNILSHKAGIGSVFEHTYRAFYDEETNLQALFDKISPTGIKRIVDGASTFEEVTENIKSFNVHDDRERYKKYLKYKKKPSSKKKITKKSISKKTKKA